MSSGITTSPELVEAFNAMKATKKYKWMTMKISDDQSTIELSDMRDGDMTLKDDKDRECWKEFVNQLDPKLPRYILYDLHCKRTDEENRIMQKIIFLTWCPDGCKIKDKMVFASSKDNLKKCLQGIDKELQTNEIGDLDYDDVKRHFDK